MYLTTENKLYLIFTKPSSTPTIPRYTIHFLHSDYKKIHRINNYRTFCFTVISVDLSNKKTWGPYSCGNWNTILQNYEVTDVVHEQYIAQVLGVHDDEILSSSHITTFLPAIPHSEWKAVNDILQSIPENYLSKDPQFKIAYQTIINRVTTLIDTVLPNTPADTPIPFDSQVTISSPTEVLSFA